MNTALVLQVQCISSNKVMYVCQYVCIIQINTRITVSQERHEQELKELRAMEYFLT